MSSPPLQPFDPSTKPKANPTASQKPETGSICSTSVSSPSTSQPTELADETQIQSATVRLLRLKPSGRKIDIKLLRCQNRNKHQGHRSSLLQSEEDRVMLEMLIKQGIPFM